MGAVVLFPTKVNRFFVELRQQITCHNLIAPRRLSPPPASMWWKEEEHLPCSQREVGNARPSASWSDITLGPINTVPLVLKVHLVGPQHQTLRDSLDDVGGDGAYRPAGSIGRKGRPKKKKEKLDHPRGREASVLSASFDPFLNLIALLWPSPAASSRTEPPSSLSPVSGSWKCWQWRTVVSSFGFPSVLDGPEQVNLSLTFFQH